MSDKMAEPTPLDESTESLMKEMAAQASLGHKRYCVGVHEHEGGELEYEWIGWVQAFGRLLKCPTPSSDTPEMTELLDEFRKRVIEWENIDPECDPSYEELARDKYVAAKSAIESAFSKLSGEVASLQAYQSAQDSTLATRQSEIAALSLENQRLLREVGSFELDVKVLQEDRARLAKARNLTPEEARIVLTELEQVKWSANQMVGADYGPIIEKLRSPGTPE